MSEKPDDPQSKKIIIDEDWKTQVQAEKEAMQHAQEPDEQTRASGAADSEPLPPPSLQLLAGTLAMQAMMSLGLMPNPVSGKAEASLPQAKHLIDMIQMLQQKTEGNRTPEESADLDSMLHELRMAFLAVQGKLGAKQ